jgi:hypothetical protein
MALHIIFFSSWSLINICFLFLLHLGVHVATIICGREPLLYLSTFWGKKTLLCLHLRNGIVIPSHHAAQAYSMKKDVINIALISTTTEFCCSLLL